MGCVGRVLTHPAVVVAVLIPLVARLADGIEWADLHWAGRQEVVRVDGSTETVRDWPVLRRFR